MRGLSHGFEMPFCGMISEVMFSDLEIWAHSLFRQGGSDLMADRLNWNDAVIAPQNWKGLRRVSLPNSQLRLN